jgi:hypothetical protein
MSHTANHATAADELHLSAYNAAFYELGLRWHWDVATYRALQQTDCEKERIRNYLHAHQAHLLKAYDADFLVQAIQTAKERCYDNLVAGGAKAPKVDWAAMYAHEIGA